MGLLAGSGRPIVAVRRTRRSHGHVLLLKRRLPEPKSQAEASGRRQALAVVGRTHRLLLL
jgi:hypothetical protein